MKSNNELSVLPTAEFKHFPALDGLRGIAVLAVLAFHGAFAVPALEPLIKNGFMGVDLFFCLSGFLITSILIKEHSKTGKIDWKNFYMRRFLRLVPAYWAFLIFVYFLGASFSDQRQTAILYDNWNFTAAFFYVWNWYYMANYPEVPSLFIHLWSLAVEEQFYLIFSLIMWLFLRFKATRTQMLYAITGLIVLLASARAVRIAAGAPQKLLIVSTEARIDGILIGVLAGMIFMWKILPDSFYESRFFKLLAALSFLTIAGVYIFASKDGLFYGLLMPVFSAAAAVLVLYLVKSAKTYAHRLLEFAPLQFTGRISYGLYMWNIVAIIIGGNFFGTGIGVVILGVVLAYGFAAVSYYKIEEPFLRLKSKFA